MRSENLTCGLRNDLSFEQTHRAIYSVAASFWARSDAMRGRFGHNTYICMYIYIHIQKIVLGKSFIVISVTRARTVLPHKFCIPDLSSPPLAAFSLCSCRSSSGIFIFHREFWREFCGILGPQKAQNVQGNFGSFFIRKFDTQN